jgi:hypothetical protein
MTLFKQASTEKELYDGMSENIDHVYDSIPNQNVDLVDQAITELEIAAKAFQTSGLIVQAAKTEKVVKSLKKKKNKKPTKEEVKGFKPFGFKKKDLVKGDDK